MPTWFANDAYCATLSSPVLCLSILTEEGKVEEAMKHGFLTLDEEMMKGEVSRCVVHV